jgi:hydrogenase maturation protein HypF
VGFRPFVWTLADRRGLRGWVRNDSSGVEIAVEGVATDVAAFLDALRNGAPPLARIDAVEVEDRAPDGHERFEILPSRAEEGAALPVSPDVATCDACLAEMRDPRDRRHRYPFLNCTDCGPRFTIVRDIPYDRPRTTMASFEMCDDCRAEYDDPADRRYHAQPVACPACGPHLRLEVNGRLVASRDDALAEARARLAAGEVLAVKGLGGFHLACDATSADAVARLRRRKHREEKPLALMARGLEVIERFAVLDETTRSLLTSGARPVVLVPARPGTPIAPQVAPHRREHGFMLPYTPLHHLLLESDGEVPEVLVMTSANLTDEPIVYRNDDAASRLADVADAFLVHDRPIHMRTDDSVIAPVHGAAYFFRRSRGYAPLPVPLPLPAGHLLAVGGELKNAFCVTRDGQAFMSHHIGDLEHLENWRALEEGLDHYERLFRIRPEAIVHDLHPDYHATRLARERAEAAGLPAVEVQHHHAHITACMADNGLAADARVIGVSFDGTGYGTDGAIWGGELLIADYASFARPLHLMYCPLPGGDAATRHPHRIALSWLREAGIAWEQDLACTRATRAEELDLLESQLRAGINTPSTSSMGRLFDAVASLAGVCHHASYEAHRRRRRSRRVPARHRRDGHRRAARDRRRRRGRQEGRRSADRVGTVPLRAC